jgi:hypothetical protein
MDRQAHIFGVQAWVVNQCLDDFGGDDWRFRPHGMSHALWILGHLVLERKALGNILGMDEKIEDRDQRFQIQTRPDDVPEDIDGKALLAEFGAVHQRFTAHLETMSDERPGAGHRGAVPEHAADAPRRAPVPADARVLPRGSARGAAGDDRQEVVDREDAGRGGVGA